MADALNEYRIRTALSNQEVTLEEKLYLELLRSVADVVNNGNEITKNIPCFSSSSGKPIIMFSGGDVAPFLVAHERQEVSFLPKCINSYSSGILTFYRGSTGILAVIDVLFSQESKQTVFAVPFIHQEALAAQHLLTEYIIHPFSIEGYVIRTLPIRDPLGLSHKELHDCVHAYIHRYASMTHEKDHIIWSTHTLQQILGLSRSGWFEDFLSLTSDE